MTARPAIARLERIVACATAGLPLEPGDAAWLASGITRTLQAGGRLDDALGLRGPGVRSPATIAARNERDSLIRATAARFYPRMDAAEAARLLATAIDRYRSSAWSRGERDAPECPARHRGRVEEMAWRILRVRTDGLSPRSIRRILSAPRGHELPGFHGHRDEGSSGINSEKDRDV